MTMEVVSEALAVGLVARDTSAMRDFYGTVLGLPTVNERTLANGTLHAFACGSSKLKLFLLDDPPDVGSPGGSHTDATGYRYITVEIANLDEVLEDVGRSQGSVTRPATDAGAVRYAFVTDPDGNLLELVEPTSAP